MADYTVQARRLHDEATAALEGAKNPGFFRSLFSSSSSASARAEQASALFAKAGATYKLAKRYADAGAAYRSAAAAAEASEEAYNAPRLYMEAAKAYKAAPDGAAAAVGAMEDAIRLHTAASNFSSVARLYKDIGEAHEEGGNADAAEAAYARAADFFKGEDARSTAVGCMEKVAAFQAERGAVADAAATYAEVAGEKLRSPLLKFGAREPLLMAGLCVAAGGDAVAARRAVDRYEGMDPSLGGTGEGRLLEGVVAALEAGDVEALTDACSEYDRVRRLDPTKTALLLRIKKGMKSAGEDDLL